MVSTHQQPPKPSVLHTLEHALGRFVLPFLLSHGAPIVFSLLLLYVLWWGHTPQVQTTPHELRQSRCAYYA